VLVCQVAAGVGGAVAGGIADAVFGALASWVVGGATWLLSQIGQVLSASAAIDLSAAWFRTHYAVMASLAAVVVLPLLLLAALQAVFRQSVGPLVRAALVQLPLALLLTGVMVQLVQLALAATDSLSTTVASGADLQQALSTLATSMSGLGGTGVPAFILLLAGLLVALGAFVLWIELLVRSAAVYAAVLFLPLALASLAWPAVSHWCRRLVETLVALILSKFVIVAVLSLAVGEIGSGTGFASVLGGGALLLLATFTPFTLLRLVPMVEAGAVHQLEGARHRVQHAVSGPVRTGISAASFALAGSGAGPLADVVPGTGSPAAAVAAAGVPGAGSAAGSGVPGETTATGGKDPAELIGPWPDGSPPSTRPAEPAKREIEPLAFDLSHAKGPIPIWGGGGPPPSRVWTPPEDYEMAHDELGPLMRWAPSGETDDEGTNRGFDRSA